MYIGKALFVLLTDFRLAPAKTSTPHAAPHPHGLNSVCNRIAVARSRFRFAAMSNIRCIITLTLAFALSGNLSEAIAAQPDTMEAWCASIGGQMSSTPPVLCYPTSLFSSPAFPVNRAEPTLNDPAPPPSALADAASELTPPDTAKNWCAAIGGRLGSVPPALCEKFQFTPAPVVSAVS